MKIEEDLNQKIDELERYKPVSGVVDEKVRKSPMAQVANAAAKRLYNLFNRYVGFL